MERLAGAVKHYDWGSRTAIAGLRGDESTDHPEAELWFGAHPAGATRLVGDGSHATLQELVDADPEGELGLAVIERFGATLPFLLKILAAARPLSLQVHPSRDEAERGFARENEAGIDRSAPDRCFRDDNHKPELIVALSSFEALVGFGEPVASLELLAGLGSEHDALLDALRSGRIDHAVAEIYRGGAEDRARLAQAVGHVCAAHRGEMSRHAEIVHELHHAYPGDPGVALAALLNLVTLAPGEGVFLHAGTPHAYVGGLGVEIMANSDNVLRGGLTSKHVDVGAFLETIEPRAVAPARLRADGTGRYPVPVDEFVLRRLAAGAEVDVSGPAIVLAVETGAEVESSDSSVGIAPTEGVWLPHSERARVRSLGSVFVAEVGATTL